MYVCVRACAHTLPFNFFQFDSATQAQGGRGRGFFCCAMARIRWKVFRPTNPLVGHVQNQFIRRKTHVAISRARAHVIADSSGGSRADASVATAIDLIEKFTDIAFKIPSFICDIAVKTERVWYEFQANCIRKQIMLDAHHIVNFALGQGVFEELELPICEHFGWDIKERRKAIMVMELRRRSGKTYLQTNYHLLQALLCEGIKIIYSTIDESLGRASFEEICQSYMMIRENRPDLVANRRFYYNKAGFKITFPGSGRRSFIMSRNGQMRSHRGYGADTLAVDEARFNPWKFWVEGFGAMVAKKGTTAKLFSTNTAIVSRRNCIMFDSFLTRMCSDMYRRYYIVVQLVMICAHCLLFVKNDDKDGCTHMSHYHSDHLEESSDVLDFVFKTASVAGGDQYATMNEEIKNVRNDTVGMVFDHKDVQEFISAVLAEERRGGATTTTSSSSSNKGTAVEAPNKFISDPLTSRDNDTFFLSCDPTGCGSSMFAVTVCVQRGDVVHIVGVGMSLCKEPEETGEIVEEVMLNVYRQYPWSIRSQWVIAVESNMYDGCVAITKTVARMHREYSQLRGTRVRHMVYEYGGDAPRRRGGVHTGTTSKGLLVLRAKHDFKERRIVIDQNFVYTQGRNIAARPSMPIPASSSSPGNDGTGPQRLSPRREMLVEMECQLSAFQGFTEGPPENQRIIYSGKKSGPDDWIISLIIGNHYCRIWSDGPGKWT